MKVNRRSFLKEFFSCKAAIAVIPYHPNDNTNDAVAISPPVTNQNGHTEKIKENQDRWIRRESVISLVDDNLLADVNLSDASKLYKMQVDVIWPKESPLLIEALKKALLNNKSNNCVRILDIGCGTGELLTRLVGDDGIFEKILPSEVRLTLVGIELDRSVYQFCQKRLKQCKHKDNVEVSIVNGNAAKLPFDSDSFDLVLNRHMLHCLPRADIPVVIDEVRRVLKGNGIAHFIVEDIEMIYTSVNNDETLSEQNQLWSDGIYQTGATVGVDLRMGRKLPSALIRAGFIPQVVEYVSVDTFHCHRQSLVDIFSLWYKMYMDAWKRNEIDFPYKKSFEDFLKVVQDKNEYICWNVPIVQAIKSVASVVH